LVFIHFLTFETLNYMEQTNPNRKKNILSFLLSFIIALALTFLLKEPGFTDSQVYVMFLLFFAVGLWLTEAIPPFAVSLLIISYLVFTLGNSHLNSAPENIAKYANTFSSSVIWLLLGGFFLAAAMSKTKLDEALFRFTLKISGTNPRNVLIGLMLTTMVASMLMSNSATTSMVIAAVMPLLVVLGKKSGFAKALLLGIPIAATTGGLGTIIGTPANAIAVGALANENISISFLQWMMYGIPVAVLLTAVSCFALIRIYIRDKTPVSLAFLDEHKEDPSPDMIRQRRIVIGVLIVTVGLWLTSSLHGLTVASICAVPLVFLTLTRILEGKDIKSLPWDALLLVAGGLSLGMALEQTGLLNHYAQKLITMDVNSIVLIVILAYVTMIVSNVMSHTAAATIMIPLGMTILVAFKADVAIIIALSSSTAMMLPVSTPPNAIAFSTGLIEQKDFRLGGILVGLLGPLLAILWVLLLT
jgi:solute carrier family 13 (sodium-dependent dicarboxylate transporter), member 2/3/5